MSVAYTVVTVQNENRINNKKQYAVSFFLMNNLRGNVVLSVYHGNNAADKLYKKKTVKKQ